MGCNCGRKNGTINYFSTEQQAKIARERGGVVTSAKSRQVPPTQETSAAKEN